MKYLGIDLGTSFLKGAVLDPERGTVEHIQRAEMPEPVAGLPPTRYELDPSAVLATVREMLGALLAEVGEVGGLVMCGQMHGLVLCDDRGNPRSNAITWRDQRALEPSTSGRTVLDDLASLVSDEERQEIGGELRVGVPITTLAWYRSHGEYLGHLFPASLLDYVLAELCDTEPTTDATSAAAHGLFHLDAGDWHRGLIGKLGLAGLRWPRIRPFGEVVGVANIAGKRFPCYTTVGDQQCALAGAGLQPGELSLNISTGSQVSLVTADRPRGEFQVRPYFGGRWLRTIVSLPAGRALAGLVDLLTELGGTGPDPWGTIGRAVDAVPDTDLEVDLSFFAGLTGDRGSITNIRETHLTVGHLFLASFRAMARNYARAAAILSPNRAWDRVVFSGGLAQKFPRLRNEILAALGDPPHRLCTHEEDTLHGLLALLRLLASSAA